MKERPLSSGDPAGGKGKKARAKTGENEGLLPTSSQKPEQRKPEEKAHGFYQKSCREATRERRKRVSVKRGGQRKKIR